MGRMARRRIQTLGEDVINKLLMKKKATIHKKLRKDFNFFSEGYLKKEIIRRGKDVVTMEMF